MRNCGARRKQPVVATPNKSEGRADSRWGKEEETIGGCLRTGSRWLHGEELAVRRRRRERAAKDEI